MYDHGFDSKFAYHVVRLLDECEQILVHQTLDLERNREQLKSIRRGEWKLEEIEEHFNTKEKSLEHLYATSTLRHSPDEEELKNLLMDCLEEHFGNLGGAVVREQGVDKMIKELEAVIRKYK